MEQQEFYRGLAQRVRDLAEQADPFTRRRLQKLAWSGFIPPPQAIVLHRCNVWRRPMMAALAKVLTRSTGADVDADGLKTILIFCRGGLFLSLMASMTYGLNIAADLF